MELWVQLAQRIARVSGEQVEPCAHAVAGGCINQAIVLGRAPRRYFVKLNAEHRLPMFEAETEGLRELAQAVRVPAPVCTGVVEGQAYLVLEHFELTAAEVGAYRRLGESLARLHGVEAAQYGWHRDNTIGSTPQPNAWRDNWWSFFSEQRLGYQLELAERNGYGGAWLRQGLRLAANLSALFPGEQPRPVLLHGDLWSGNVGFRRGGEPVVFDPACYYGDGASDLAMTELFGGFPAEFYQAYQAARPLQDDYPLRRDLYQLYHVLNHLNLFGGAYLSQARQLLGRLCAV